MSEMPGAISDPIPATSTWLVRTVLPVAQFGLPFTVRKIDCLGVFVYSLVLAKSARYLALVLFTICIISGQALSAAHSHEHEHSQACHACLAVNHKQELDDDSNNEDPSDAGCPYFGYDLYLPAAHSAQPTQPVQATFVHVPLHFHSRAPPTSD